jgi:hypothetical protein
MCTRRVAIHFFRCRMRNCTLFKRVATAQATLVGVSPLFQELFVHGLAVQLTTFTEWHPKITTLPGMYIISAVVFQLNRLIVPSISCDVHFLRYVSLALAVGLTFTMGRLLRRLHGDRVLTAWQLLMNSTVPFLAFFCTMYYTDCGSLLFVLLCYYWSLPTQGTQHTSPFTRLLSAMASLRAAVAFSRR